MNNQNMTVSPIAYVISVTLITAISMFVVSQLTNVFN